ncbi:MAG TPA: immunoglobulin domain-containing protein, partial [Verrucomicrobiae bacterium]
MKIQRLFLCLTAVCVFIGRAWAGDLINVDFDQVGNPAFRTKIGPAAIGLTSDDFWNDYPGANALKWSDGTASPATLTGTAPPPWFTWNYDAMFQSYTYSSDLINLNISGLPAGAYDFYVYAHGQPTNEIGKIELKRGATSLGVKTTSSALDWDKAGWTEGGEYVVFRGVEVTDGQTVQLISSPGGLNGPAVLNGLQILNSAHTNFAPVISEYPYHQTVVTGGTIRLEPSVLGTEPFRYQWKKNGQPVENATTRVLEIQSAQAGDEGTYSVSVENDFGSTTSAGTLVKMISSTGAPIINIDVENPELPVYSTKTGPAVIGASNSDVWNAVVGAAANLKTSDGTTTSARAFLGNATGWWFSENRDPMFLSYAAAASSLTLSISDIPLGVYDVYVYAHGQAATENSAITMTSGDQSWGPKVTSSSAGWNPPGWTESYQYVVFRGVAVTNGNLVIFSTRDAGQSAILNGAQIVRTGAVPPQIIQQPTSIIVSPGKSFTLSVVAGGESLAYQWQKDGADIDGATSSSYTVASAVAADHSGSYRVKVTNSNGFVLSDAATVSVRYLPPVITTQPKSISVTESNSFTLQIVAASDAPLTYQWEHSGTNIDGAVSAELTVSSATTNDTGSYRVKVSNEGGDTFSDVAVVTIYGANVTLLNVNFGYETEIKVGPAATGLSSADFWNHYSFPFAAFASMTNLAMADHSPSSVGFTVENGPGQWYFGRSSGDIMYNNYIYVSGTIKATLYNLPPGAYDLYLYGHADVDNANSVFTVKSGATTSA